MANLLEILERERRMLAQKREISDLRGEVEKLREQNERMRTAMRRCITCDYRIEIVGRDSATVSSSGSHT